MQKRLKRALQSLYPTSEAWAQALVAGLEAAVQHPKSPLLEYALPEVRVLAAWSRPSIHASTSNRPSMAALPQEPWWNALPQEAEGRLFEAMALLMARNLMERTATTYEHTNSAIPFLQWIQETPERAHQAAPYIAVMAASEARRMESGKLVDTQWRTAWEQQMNTGRVHEAMATPAGQAVIEYLNAKRPTMASQWQAQVLRHGLQQDVPEDAARARPRPRM